MRLIKRIRQFGQQFRLKELCGRCSAMEDEGRPAEFGDGDVKKWKTIVEVDRTGKTSTCQSDSTSAVDHCITYSKTLASEDCFQDSPRTSLALICKIEEWSIVGEIYHFICLRTSNESKFYRRMEYERTIVEIWDCA